MTYSIEDARKFGCLTNLVRRHNLRTQYIATNNNGGYDFTRAYYYAEFAPDSELRKFLNKQPGALKSGLCPEFSSVEYLEAAFRSIFTKHIILV